jgi:hypothetical protein
MRKLREKSHVVLIATLIVFYMCVMVASASADTLLTHTFDQSSNLYASQNDTNGFGLFAQMYDNFTLSNATTISEVQWTGGYFNPPNQGPITGWTIGIYDDNAGQPGSLVYTFQVAGTGGETFLDTFGGFPIYTYDVAGLNFAASGNTQYWLDLYPDLAFPPQWGWSSASNQFGPCDGCDGLSYQDFLGARGPIAADMAFTLVGSSSVPEPGTLIMLGTGVMGLAGALRRKLF